MAKLKGLNNVLTEEEISTILAKTNPDTSKEIDFEFFLRVFPPLSCCNIFQQLPLGHIVCLWLDNRVDWTN